MKKYKQNFGREISLWLLLGIPVKRSEGNIVHDFYPEDGGNLSPKCWQSRIRLESRGHSVLHVR
jgi:hypothetical protein